MDVTAIKIVRQPNGKFALWNEKSKSFDLYNYDSAKDIKDHLLSSIDRDLTANITSHAGDDAWFKLCVDKYKIKSGIDTSPRRSAEDCIRAMTQRRF